MLNCFNCSGCIIAILVIIKYAFSVFFNVFQSGMNISFLVAFYKIIGCRKLIVFK